jgi:hypothetical protein
MSKTVGMTLMVGLLFFFSSLIFFGIFTDVEHPLRGSIFIGLLAMIKPYILLKLSE